MEGDRQGVGTDKEGGERVKGGTQGGGQTGREDTGRGDTGRGDRQGGGMDREGIQTRRGYEQGGDTDKEGVLTGRGYRQDEGGPSFVESWGGGGSPSSARARGWWLWWALVARCRLRVVMGVRSWLFVRGGPSFVGGKVVVVRASSRVLVVVGARWLVRGSRVVGWVFGCGPWDLDFVLAMERARGHSPKE
jgi:hypothetical protein